MTVPHDTPIEATVTIHVSVPVVVSREPVNEADMTPFVARCPDLALSPRRATAEGALAAVHNTVRAALLSASRGGGR